MTHLRDGGGCVTRVGMKLLFAASLMAAGMLAAMPADRLP
jgi:hypothetical protein